MNHKFMNHKQLLIALRGQSVTAADVGWNPVKLSSSPEIKDFVKEMNQVSVKVDSITISKMYFGRIAGNIRVDFDYTHRMFPRFEYINGKSKVSFKLHPDVRTSMIEASKELLGPAVSDFVDARQLNNDLDEFTQTVALDPKVILKGSTDFAKLQDRMTKVWLKHRDKLGQ